MIEDAGEIDELKNQPQVQAGGAGAGISGRGTRNWAGEEGPGGEPGRYKPGQHLVCKVGLCEYKGGYSVTVLETGKFGFLKTSTILTPNDEIDAVFVGWSPEGRYNQHWKFPLLALPFAPKKATLSDFVPCNLQKLDGLNLDMAYKILTAESYEE